MAIKSFRDKRTAALFLGLPVKGLPHELRKRARAKMAILHRAGGLDDLRVWSTITEEMTMAIRMENLTDLDFSDLLETGGRRVGTPHPGEILLHEFLEPMGITQYRLAKSIGVPQRRIGEIVSGIRGVTVDTGLRLSRFFGMSEGFWTGLQVDYDAAQVKRKIGKVLDKIEPWKAAQAA